MVGREVDGPLCAVLGRSWDLCWRSWAALGPFVGGLALLLGPMVAVLCRFGIFVGGPDPSWAALLGYVGGLGSLWGPMLGVLGLMLAVLGCSWDLCWRSWAALWASVGGLGPMLAVLGGLRPKSGPNPSGKAIQEAARA